MRAPIAPAIGAPALPAAQMREVEGLEPGAGTELREVGMRAARVGAGVGSAVGRRGLCRETPAGRLRGRALLPRRRLGDGTRLNGEENTGS
jgi:hypothetical protein